jgi:dolichol-phosphate mannosyltransferase
MGSQPSQGPSLSIVLPAFNEAATIAQAVREAEAALGRLGCAFEIIVVDDGSADGTAEIAEAAGGPAVRVVRHAQNRGYGVALRTGFAASRGDLIGFSDADCQFDLGEIDRLVLLCRDHDAACGASTGRTH